MTRALPAPVPQVQVSRLPLCYSRGGSERRCGLYIGDEEPQTKGIHMVRKCLQHSYR
jgi:hypothetical protein